MAVVLLSAWLAFEKRPRLRPGFGPGRRIKCTSCSLTPMTHSRSRRARRHWKKIKQFQLLKLFLLPRPRTFYHLQKLLQLLRRRRLLLGLLVMPTKQTLRIPLEHLQCCCLSRRLLVLRLMEGMPPHHQRSSRPQRRLCPLLRSLLQLPPMLSPRRLGLSLRQSHGPKSTRCLLRPRRRRLHWLHCRRGRRLQPAPPSPTSRRARFVAPKQAARRPSTRPPILCRPCNNQGHDLFVSTSFSC